MARSVTQAEQGETRRMHRVLAHIDRHLDQPLELDSLAAARAGTADHGVARTCAMEGPMNVTLIDREPTTVAYLRYVGPYGPAISEFWQETVYPWLLTNNLLERPPTYDPRTGEFECDLCIPVAVL